MRLSQKSQSIIEYATLIILVIIGLILMRPYVIRAINAHMKSWEDATTDSLRDDLRESIPPLPAECGDRFCDPRELTTCCLDCGSCGDCNCCTEASEDIVGPTYCAMDCGYCGDGQPTPAGCGRPQDESSTGYCCWDFPVVCPDGFCCRDESGTAVLGECWQDCPELDWCGNGNCTPLDPPCCADCGPYCPNGSCDCGETRRTCVDCCGAIPSCVVDGTCETWCGESQANCCQDCGGCDPCAGVTEAMCNSRGSGNCCFDGCCTKCIRAGSYGGCIKRPPGWRCCVSCGTCFPPRACSPPGAACGQP